MSDKRRRGLVHSWRQRARSGKLILTYLFIHLYILFTSSSEKNHAPNKGENYRNQIWTFSVHILASAAAIIITQIYQSEFLLVNGPRYNIIIQIL